MEIFVQQNGQGWPQTGKRPFTSGSTLYASATLRCTMQQGTGERSVGDTATLSALNPGNNTRAAWKEIDQEMCRRKFGSNRLFHLSCHGK